MDIVVVGMGYVGLSVAVLLAQNNNVCAVDIVSEKVDKINSKISPIRDDFIERYFESKNLQLTATLNSREAYTHAELVIIAVPTDFDNRSNSFQTDTIEEIIQQVINFNRNSLIVIKSTVPIGFTSSIRKKYQYDKILVSPEFLRESKALFDNLYPSRIIVGTDTESEKMRRFANSFAALLQQGSIKREIPTLIMSYSEAEAVKLFANTYLALRVGYFNELDTYAEIKGLSAKNIINGVCFDPRIGNFYNNPSFGYGGYCLPKDTRQLLANFQDVPQKLISAIVATNQTREDFISEHVFEMATTFDGNDKFINEKEVVIGIFRLNMKFGSDNLRNSSVLDILVRLQKKHVLIILYEPILGNMSSYTDCEVVNNLDEFKERSSVIIANRYDNVLDDIKDKVYTRDLFMKD